MKIENAIASLAVRDVKSASTWYAKLFRRPPDSTPMPEVVEWKFERGGWLQIYEERGRAGAGSCTLAVSDIAGLTTHLESLGLDAGNSATGAKVKTVMITDPDGNHLAFAETIDPTMAR